MPSFLISFTTPRQDGPDYNSTVLDLPGAPLTPQAILDLQSSLAMDYGAESVLLQNWEFLPDRSEHPGKGPYCYYVVHHYKTTDGWNLTSSFIQRTDPILTLVDLRLVEEHLRSTLQASRAHVQVCRPMMPLTSDLLHQTRDRQSFWQYRP